MSALQGSLLDCGTRDGATTPGLLSLREGMTRQQLGNGAWIDVRPSWVSSSDELLGELMSTVPWRSERREMYDAVVAVPRLLAFYPEGAPLPHALVDEARRRLCEHYRDELGEDFVTAGLCWYRDGRDSVAWHGDRTGRSWDHDTMIAIVALGANRPLCLRPRGGGPIRRVAAGHGDLIVMGGSCQRTFDHAILKTSASVGPRISIQFRVRGVR